MKNIAVLHGNGKIHYHAEWPDSYGKAKCEFPCYEDEICQCEINEKQALANGIELRDQEEINKILFEKYFDGKIMWQLKSLKPYEIPSELKIIIGEDGCEGNCYCNSGLAGSQQEISECPNIKKFAFIERQLKEETQDELLNALIGAIEAGYTKEELIACFRINRIK